MRELEIPENQEDEKLNLLKRHPCHKLQKTNYKKPEIEIKRERYTHRQMTRRRLQL